MSSYEGAFSYSYRVLRNLGLWKTDSEVPWKVTLHRCYQCIALTYSFIVTLLPCIDFVLSLNDIRKWTFNLCFTITVVATFFKTCRLLWHCDTISKLREDMNRDLSTEPAENRRILELAAKELTTLFKTMTSWGYVLYVVWMSIPFTAIEERRLPLQMWLPFDAHVSPNYEIAYCFHVLVGFVLVITVFGTNMTIVGFTIRICAEYDILKNTISQFSRELVDSNSVSEEKRAAEFRDIVRHHQKIIGFVERLGLVYEPLLNVQFIGSIVLLVIIGLDIILVSSTQKVRLIVQIQYTLITLMDLSTYCVYGTRLIEKSNELANVVFTSEWYIMTPAYRRGFAFVIQRSQKCPRLVIAGMYSINLNLYLEMLKVTYNIFAVMWQVTSAERLQST